MKAGELLIAAAETVQGPRADAYGPMATNCGRIADLWNSWLENRRGPACITAYDVPAMMLMLKMARLMNTPGHADSHLDIAGYVSMMEEIGPCLAH